jgi:hypothetical protein
MKNDDQPSIALVIPYFGKWPEWMDAFLISCAWNPDVDWHFISDCGEPAAHPPNVHFHESTLERVSAQASKTLGFPVELKRPYKLCDLKPAYGLMFSELLEGYDFWGHCDPDILWGNIRKFMTPELLNRYDILTTRKHALAGHFCVYRNEERINRICLETHDWERMLNDNDTSYMLDEAFFSRLIEERATSGKIQVYWNRSLATSGSDQKPTLLGGQTLRWKKGRPVDEDGKPVNYRHWLFRGRPLIWKKGRTWNAYGQEMMYLHFHQLKNGFGPCSIQYASPPEQMIIDKMGIRDV